METYSQHLKRIFLFDYVGGGGSASVFVTVILETFPIWAGMLLAKCAAAGMESGLFRSKYIWDKKVHFESNKCV